MARFDLNHPYILHCGQKKRDDDISCASTCTDPVRLLCCWLSRTDRRSVTFDPCFPSNPHLPRQRPKEAIFTSFPFLSSLSLLLSHTFPASGAHCCRERSVSPPLHVKWILCSLPNRKAWPHAVGSPSMPDVVHWLYIGHPCWFFFSFLFFLLKVVLEQFHLFIVEEEKRQSTPKVSIRLPLKLPGCPSEDIWVWQYWPLRYQLCGGRWL